MHNTGLARADFDDQPKEIVALAYIEKERKWWKRKYVTIDDYNNRIKELCELYTREELLDLAFNRKYWRENNG